MNTAKAPLNDAAARRAVRFAINSAQFLETFLLGFGQEPGQDLIPPLNPWNLQLQPMRFSPDECRAELSGVGGGLELTVAVLEQWSEAARIVADAALTCGIGMNLERVPRDGLWSLDRGRYDMVFRAMSHNGRPMSLIDRLAHGATPWAVFGFEDEEVSSQLVAYGSSGDAGQRSQIAGRLGQAMQERGPIAQVAWLPNTALVNTRVAGFSLAADGRFEAARVSIAA